MQDDLHLLNIVQFNSKEYPRLKESNFENKMSHKITLLYLTKSLWSELYFQLRCFYFYTEILFSWYDVNEKKIKKYDFLMNECKWVFRAWFSYKIPVTFLA